MPWMWTMMMMIITRATTTTTMAEPTSPTTAIAARIDMTLKAFRLVTAAAAINRDVAVLGFNGRMICVWRTLSEPGMDQAIIIHHSRLSPRPLLLLLLLR